MGEFPPSTRLVRFGVFEVDLHSGELRKRGVRLKLQGQPYLFLVTLLKRHGELVTREEIRSTLWPDGTFTDFDHGVGTALNKLRDVLNDSATNPRFVETLPRRGYRFIAPVEFFPTLGPAEVTVAGTVVQEQLATDQSATTNQIDAEAPPSDAGQGQPKVDRSLRRRSAWIAIAAMALIASAAFAVWRARPATPPIRSLAVLPLENLSGDPSQDYFSDGMTDELIAEIGKISELRVISRTSVMSYKAVRKTLPQIALELNVNAILEGTVRRAGNHVRITLQLIEAPSDRHLWAQSYEGDLGNILSLQTTVGRAVAEQARLKLTEVVGGDRNGARELNVEAHEAYLKGRFFWNKRTGADLKRAVEYFRTAIDKDPNYAQAYSGLADAYALMGDWEYGVLPPTVALPRAKAAAAKALSLDNGLGEAHTSLAFALDLYDWDWESAEKEYVRALALSPSYGTAHQWYAWHLIMTGRGEDALAEMRKAQTLDPLSLIISADMADLLLIGRKYDESIRQSRRTLDIDPRFAVAHYQLGQALVQKKTFSEAIDEFQSAIGFSPGNKTFTANLAYAYAVSGRERKRSNC